MPPNATSRDTTGQGVAQGSAEWTREARAIRPDYHHSDLYLLTNADRGILQGTQSAAPTGWRRFADYVLEALRYPGGEHLTTPPAEAWQQAMNTGSE